MTAGKGPCQVPGLEIIPEDDGYVVFRPGGERVHHLNPTAALILELCTGEHDSDAVAGLVQQLYGLRHPPRSETEALLTALEGEGLITLPHAQGT